MSNRKIYGGLRIKEYSLEQRQQFLRFFGRSLATYWNAFLGFDNVKLDKHLNVPEDESLSNFLLEHYGQEAHDLVETLVHM
jgi:hypothetical protein